MLRKKKASIVWHHIYVYEISKEVELIKQPESRMVAATGCYMEVMMTCCSKGTNYDYNK